MSRLSYVTVDVFTDSPFGGNPLAVVFGGETLSGSQMQTLAREFNLSETVFVLPAEKPGGAARLRIFTPAVELPFAGHPTVGTAYVLAARGAVDHDASTSTLTLEENIGDIEVRVSCQDGAVIACQLTAAQAPEARQVELGPETIAEVLSLEGDAVRTDDLAPVATSAGFPFLYVPLVDRAEVARASLDWQAWETHLRGSWADNVFLFAMDGADTDVHARMFGPSVGGPEDPATGAAATGLAGVLGAADPRVDGTLEWSVAQGVEMGRPSRMNIEADKVDGRVVRVRVGGASVPISEGTVTIPAL